LKGTIPARFGLIWFSGFRGEDLNVIVVRPSTFHILIFSSETTGPIAAKLWWNGPWMAPFQIFYQNMPNLHNRYISAERNIS
jgi:hypothetical protein